MNRNRIFAHRAADRRRGTLLFQLVCIFLSLTLLLCSCAQNALKPETSPAPTAAETATEPTAKPTAVPTVEPTVQPTTVPTEEPIDDAVLQDPLTSLQEWLGKDFSFTLSYRYLNLGINGLSQETTQTFASDGCWFFENQQKIWDHTVDYEAEEKAEFYYCYEDSQLICYSSINGNTPQRAVLSKADQKAMKDSKAYMIGVPGLLPDYLQDFSVTQTEDAAIINYMLPVENVLADGTLPAVYVQNVFALSNCEYKPEDQLLIGCTFETDPETFRPKSLSFDFSQLKPYVLTDGAQSGEFALDSDFMTMVYTFDYNLPSTIAMPENLIP